MPFISYLTNLNHCIANTMLPSYANSQTITILGLHLDSCNLNSTTNFRSSKLVLAAESLYRFSRLQHNNHQLFQELLNKYWRQTIFLSNSSPVTQKYSALLAKQDTILLRANRKKFLTELNKALQHGNIFADISQIESNNIKFSKQPTTIRYIWGKNLNIKLPQYLNEFFVNRRSPNFPTYLQDILLQRLQKNNFPIFVVANGFNQIVVADPASELIHRNNIFNKVYYWYYDRFLWTKDINAVHEGWFFVNPKDAEEYAEFIKSRYPRSSNQNNLNVLPTSLSSYYCLNRLAPPRTEFRLFPDLEEVGKIVMSSRHRQGLKFDSKQQYSKKYFQGQPIYFIESVRSTNRANGVKSEINYYYQIPGDSTGQKYTAVFFNKKIALKAWSNFRHSNSHLNLPTIPILRVYNLEDFLKDNESNVQLANKNFLFIPSEDAYQYIKSSMSYSSSDSSTMHKKLILYKLTLSLWIQRLVWSLTSRQPPNW
uniref:Uncharacterized protein n=1 Tax=Trichogloeopsis pedicellata TaxID=1495610 RepID=A0A1G4P0M5_9FLOR|nr:Hypothetical protein ORF_2 [Trichogloeopsis pedicellata]SCW24376.1 Hypothetical protein ORF_2 [Trichogloeopsis pedicellata]